MKYIRVRWKHEGDEFPVLYYHELDAQRCELRSVVIFQDGRIGYASADGTSSNAELGTEPIPEISQMAKDPELEPAEITQEEFEAIWSQRTSRSPLDTIT